MPLYEYRCEECGEKFEVFKMGNQDEEICCPRCKSKRTSRMFSTFASHGGSSSGSTSYSGGSCGSSGFS
jgi:putative FmdB family regulatory protein